jgi:hypothetical protein
MVGSVYRRGHSLTWLLALALITSVSAAVYLVTLYFDFRSGGEIAFPEILFSHDAMSAMSNMPEVIAGVLGITITVVAIIVELAANRYTPRVTDLFVKSPTNIGVLGFFVVTCLLCIWVSLTGGREGFVPRIGTLVTVSAITACLLLLLPYFVFVFNFLDPHHIIGYMGSSALSAITLGQGGPLHRRRRAKLAAVSGIEQLADVALNAIEHKDKGICMHAVDTLGKLTRDYLAVKPGMPAAWFAMDEELAENPDFVSMQADVIRSIEAQRCWLEMKVLRQFQMLYGETLNRMRDINYLIAINTRKLAENALRTGQRQTAVIAVKFLNTYLRATLNGQDVRTAYNVLNQYRLLAEFALMNEAHDEVVEAARRFKYYGQLGFSIGLPFVLETAAFDLCRLNELAFDLSSPCRGELLAIFLEVDKEAEEGHALEASLRGVRKAQIKLATYYLTKGETEAARAIFEDMKNEVKGRLASIRKELEAIESPDFWEISDRGVNFDYLEPDRRNMLETFFNWFEMEKTT